MANIRFRQDQDGLTLSRITQAIFFSDSYLDEASTTTWYFLTCEDLDDQTIAFTCFKKDPQKHFLTLPVPFIRYNRRYKVQITRYEVPDPAYEPVKQQQLTDPTVYPDDNWNHQTSSPITIYTPAFPHTWVIPSKRSFKIHKPYVLSSMREAIQFTKVSGLQEYTIAIHDESGTLLDESVYAKQNQEYYFRPKNIPTIALGKTYMVRAKVKVTEYRDDFGPASYIRTPDFPKPAFNTVGQDVDIQTKDIQLDDTYKKFDVTGFEYELTSTDSTSSTYGEVTTLTANKPYLWSIALKWFSGTKNTVNPQTILNGKSYTIRCRLVREYTVNNNPTTQTSPWSDPLTINTKPQL